MKLYIADYHVETTDLDVVGHGAYLLLLMAMWRAGGKLPRDELKLAKLAKCSAEQWAAVRDDVMSHFKVTGNTIWHGRVLKEIAKYDAVVNGSSQAGKASASKRSKKNSDQAPTDVENPLNGNPTNQNQNQNQKEIKDPPSESPLCAKVEDLGADDMLAAMFGDPGPDPSDRGTGPMLTAIPKSAAKRAQRRCPVTWSPNPKHEAIAFSDLHMTGQQYDLQLAMFRDYQFKNALTDWDAAFRNWLRKPFTSTPRGTNGHGQPTYYDRKNDAYARELGGVFEAMDAAVQQSAGRHRG